MLIINREELEKSAKPLIESILIWLIQVDSDISNYIGDINAKKLLKRVSLQCNNVINSLNKYKDIIEKDISIVNNLEHNVANYLPNFASFNKKEQTVVNVDNSNVASDVNASNQDSSVDVTQYNQFTSEMYDYMESSENQYTFEDLVNEGYYYSSEYQLNKKEGEFCTKSQELFERWLIGDLSPEEIKQYVKEYNKHILAANIFYDTALQSQLLEQIANKKTSGIKNENLRNFVIYAPETSLQYVHDNPFFNNSKYVEILQKYNSGNFNIDQQTINEYMSVFGVSLADARLALEILQMKKIQLYNENCVYINGVRYSYSDTKAISEHMFEDEEFLTKVQNANSSTDNQYSYEQMFQDRFYFTSEEDINIYAENLEKEGVEIYKKYKNKELTKEEFNTFIFNRNKFQTACTTYYDTYAQANLMKDIEEELKSSIQNPELLAYVNDDSNFSTTQPDEEFLRTTFDATDEEIKIVFSLAPIKQIRLENENYIYINGEKVECSHSEYVVAHAQNDPEFMAMISQSMNSPECQYSYDLMVQEGYIITDAEGIEQGAQNINDSMATAYEKFLNDELTEEELSAVAKNINKYSFALDVLNNPEVLPTVIQGTIEYLIGNIEDENYRLYYETSYQNVINYTSSMNSPEGFSFENISENDKNIGNKIKTFLRLLIITKGGNYLFINGELNNKPIDIATYAMENDQDFIVAFQNTSAMPEYQWDMEKLAEDQYYYTSQEEIVAKDNELKERIGKFILKVMKGETSYDSDEWKNLVSDIQKHNKATEIYMDNSQNTDLLVMSRNVFIEENFDDPEVVKYLQENNLFFSDDPKNSTINSCPNYIIALAYYVYQSGQLDESAFKKFRNYGLFDDTFADVVIYNPITNSSNFVTREKALEMYGITRYGEPIYKFTQEDIDIFCQLYGIDNIIYETKDKVFINGIEINDKEQVKYYMFEDEKFNKDFTEAIENPENQVDIDDLAYDYYYFTSLEEIEKEFDKISNGLASVYIKYQNGLISEEQYQKELFKYAKEYNKWQYATQALGDPKKQLELLKQVEVNLKLHDDGGGWYETELAKVRKLIFDYDIVIFEEEKYKQITNASDYVEYSESELDNELMSIAEFLSSEEGMAIENGTVFWSWVFGELSSSDVSDLITYGTLEEKQTFYYCYNNSQYITASKYYSKIKSSLDERKASKITTTYKDSNYFIRTLIGTQVSVSAGIETIKNIPVGLWKMVIQNEDYTFLGPNTVAFSDIQTIEESVILKWYYNGLKGATEMLPAVGLSYLFGPDAGSIYIWALTASNTYIDSINSGHSAGEATALSVVNGTIAVFSEKLFGAIPFLGKTGKYINKFVPNKYARFFLKSGVEMAQEIGEESVNNFAANVIYGENNPWMTWEDAVNIAGSTFFSNMFMQAYSAPVAEAKRTSDIDNINIDVNNLYTADFNQQQKENGKKSVKNNVKKLISQYGIGIVTDPKFKETLSIIEKNDPKLYEDIIFNNGLSNNDIYVLISNSDLTTLEQWVNNKDPQISNIVAEILNSNNKGLGFFDTAIQNNALKTIGKLNIELDNLPTDSKAREKFANSVKKNLGTLGFNSINNPEVMNFLKNLESKDFGLYTEIIFSEELSNQNILPIVFFSDPTTIQKWASDPNLDFQYKIQKGREQYQKMSYIQQMGNDAGKYVVGDFVDITDNVEQESSTTEVELLPQDAFNFGQISIYEVISNWDVYKNIDLSVGLANDPNNKLNITDEQLKIFMDKYGDIVHLIFNNNASVYRIVRGYSRLTDDTKKQEYMKSVVDTILEEISIGKIDISDQDYKNLLKYTSLKDYLIKLNPNLETEINIIFNNSENITQEYILNSSISVSALTDPDVIKFISMYGIENIIEFDNENNKFFTKNNCQNLKDVYKMYIHRATYETDTNKSLILLQEDGSSIIGRNCTKDEFYEIVRRIVIYGPTDYNYYGNYLNISDITGEFKNNNLDLYISEDAPLELQNAFYNKTITPQMLSLHPEYITYLEGKNMNYFKYYQINVDGNPIGFYDFISGIDTSDNIFNFIIEYADIIQICIDNGYIDKLDFSSKDTINDIENKFNIQLKNMIVENNIEYPKNIPDSFKKENPNLFLSEDAPQDLKDAFYKRQITTDFIMANPEYYQYLSGVDSNLIYGQNIIHYEDGTSIDVSNIVMNIFGETDGFNIMLSYGKYFEILFKENPNLRFDSNMSKEEFLNIVDSNLYNMIINGKIKYDESMSQHFKNNYPMLFLSEDVPIEYRNEFYNKEFTINDFISNPKLIEYFENTNILYGLSEDVTWMYNFFENVDGSEFTNEFRLKVVEEYLNLDSESKRLFKNYIIYSGDLNVQSLKSLLNVISKISSGDLFENLNNVNLDDGLKFIYANYINYPENINMQNMSVEDRQMLYEVAVINTIINNPSYGLKFSFSQLDNPQIVSKISEFISGNSVIDSKNSMEFLLRIPENCRSKLLYENLILKNPFIINMLPNNLDSMNETEYKIWVEGIILKGIENINDAESFKIFNMNIPKELKTEKVWNEILNKSIEFNLDLNEFASLGGVSVINITPNMIKRAITDIDILEVYYIPCVDYNSSLDPTFQDWNSSLTEDQKQEYRKIYEQYWIEFLNCYVATLTFMSRVPPEVRTFDMFKACVDNDSSALWFLLHDGTMPVDISQRIMEYHIKNNVRETDYNDTRGFDSTILNIPAKYFNKEIIEEWLKKDYRYMALVDPNDSNYFNYLDIAFDRKLEYIGREPLTTDEKMMIQKFAINNSNLFSTLSIEMLDPNIINVIGMDSLEKIVRYPNLQRQILDILKNPNSLKVFNLVLEYLKLDNNIFIEPLIERININLCSKRFIELVGTRLSDSQNPVTDYEMTIITYLVLNPAETKNISNYDDILNYPYNKNINLNNIIENPNSTSIDIKDSYFQRYVGMTYEDAKKIVLTYGNDAEELLTYYEQKDNLSDKEKNEMAAIKLVITMKKIYEMDNPELLKQDYNNRFGNEKIDVQIIRYQDSMVLETILKRAYGRDLKNSLTALDTNNMKEYQFGDEKYYVIEVEGDFNKVVTVSEAWRSSSAKEGDMYDRWNTSKMAENHALCFSLINNSNIGTAVSVVGDKGIIISIGGDSLSPESLSAVGPYDLQSTNSMGVSTQTDRPQRYFMVENMPGQTRGMYSEYVIELQDVNSNNYMKIQPVSIICFDTVDEASIRASIELSNRLGVTVPIELIDRRKLANNEMGTINDLTYKFTTEKPLNMNYVRQTITIFNNVRNSMIGTKHFEEIVGESFNINGTLTPENSDALFNKNNLNDIIMGYIDYIEKMIAYGYVEEGVKALIELKFIINDERQKYNDISNFYPIPIDSGISTEVDYRIDNIIRTHGEKNPTSLNNIESYNILFNFKGTNSAYWDYFIEEYGVKLPEQLNLSDVIGYVDVDKLKYDAQDVYSQGLYQNNEYFDIEHIFRVMLYSEIIVKNEGYDEHTQYLVRETAKYYCCGKELKGYENHEIYSAELASKYLEGKCSDYDLNIILASIEYQNFLSEIPNVTESEAQNIRNKKIEYLCKKYNLSDEQINQVIIVSSIVNDSSELDRTRFINKSSPNPNETNDFNPINLHSNTAKQMFSISCSIQEQVAEQKIEHYMDYLPSYISFESRNIKNAMFKIAPDDLGVKATYTVTDKATESWIVRYAYLKQLYPEIIK